MKVTFEFDTQSETFDQQELNRHYAADKMAFCLFDITNKLRSWYKYDTRGEIPIDEVYDQIFDIINQYVDIDDILR